jgi:NAD(P)-dependent dehydrogenase (short-subunit alcohol dehydrogenase family)
MSSDDNPRPGQRAADGRGSVAVVTGGNSGIGYETALALAGRGASVVIAARSVERGEAAAARIASIVPQADVSVGALDLSDLRSVAAFADDLKARFGRLDLLINNAGVMTPPQRRETVDGHELQFGTNHLGHFALTGHLLPLLQGPHGARVVTLSSLMHWFGKIDFDDLQGRRYSPDRAYAQSKLANLLFARQLDWESRRQGWGLISVAAHPGIARTDLVANGPGATSTAGRINKVVVEPLLSQSGAAGALPTLLAATSADVVGGDYYGPTRLLGMKGPPGQARSSRRAKDEATAGRLWAVSEQLTGVSYR